MSGLISQWEEQQRQQVTLVLLLWQGQTALRLELKFNFSVKL